MRNAYSPDTVKGEYEVIWRRFFSEPISHSYYGILLVRASLRLSLQEPAAQHIEFQPVV